MSASLLDGSALDFALPDDLVATSPAEPRDAVRLLVATPDELTHAAFADLPGFLAPGDLVVVNTSATLPASVPTTDGRLVHLSTELPGGLWLVEVRLPHGSGSRPFPDARPGERVCLPRGGTVALLSPYGPSTDRGVRLWVATLRLPLPLLAYLERHGRPVRYDYAAGDWPLDAYQTVFATDPGSAEMPSAGRAFTGEILARLAARGVGVTPITLHTGVSSQDAGEAPYPERYVVPLATAERINATRAAGGRILAVGTTVTRALETVADERGRAHPGFGLTDLVVTPERGVRVVDGLLTGWHAPRASHLDLLVAVAGTDLVTCSYAAALDARYRWHEFGDLHLLLP